MNQEKIEKLWREILIEIGENPDREGLKETPKRIAKMYTEIFRGYDEKSKPVVTIFPNNEDGVNYSGMICDKGYFFSHCEHHNATFIGNYFFAYVPNEKIIGLSKISRIVDFFAAKLQIQERLTKEIVDYIEKVVKPKGIILVMKARHLCKEMRGVKKINSEMTTSEVRGLFDVNKDNIKGEFFKLMEIR